MNIDIYKDVIYHLFFDVGCKEGEAGIREQGGDHAGTGEEHWPQVVLDQGHEAGAGLDILPV